ncbi:MAG: CoA-binding protein, partial [Chloroflexi bacterium]|nr:CoA-binding protein [Chloroflexota bacterium]
MAWDKGFEAALSPKAIAIVGVSSKHASWGAGGFIGCLKRMRFEGGIYPVNPNATEIQELKVYPNLVSIPEHVDLVIVSVPAPAVPGVLEDCIAAGAKNVHIFTAGFEETGEAEGRELGEKVKAIARRGGLRIIGPNCMGLTVPGAKISTLFESLVESGPVAFITQSGTLAGNYNRYAEASGFRFSKVFSFGNAYVLDS